MAEPLEALCRRDDLEIIENEQDVLLDSLELAQCERDEVFPIEPAARSKSAQRARTNLGATLAQRFQDIRPEDGWLIVRRVEGHPCCVPFSLLEPGANECCLTVPGRSHHQGDSLC